MTKSERETYRALRAAYEKIREEVKTLRIDRCPVCHRYHLPLADGKRFVSVVCGLGCPSCSDTVRDRLPFFDGEEGLGFAFIRTILAERERKRKNLIVQE